MQSIGRSQKLVDYIFWIVLIAFTNPGGILQALGEDSTDGGINVSDLLFVVLSICFLIVYRKEQLIRNRTFTRLTQKIIIFILYFLIVFCFFIPQFKNDHNTSLIFTMIKVRHGIINIFLVFYIYIFYLRSYRIFFSLFLYSSIVVMGMFLTSIIFGFEILPVKLMNRGYVETSRQLMVSYGLMPILIPMGVVALTFKFNIDYKKAIVFSAILMFLVWVFALIRRNIFGAIIYFFVASFMLNYILRKPLIPIKSIISTSVYVMIMILLIQFAFPKYFEAGLKSIDEAYHIVKYGETISGQSDNRLGFGKKEMQDKIARNYIVGTGFHDDWRRSEEAGFEASDYPFLAAIAMSGVLGLLFFLPIYLLLIRMLISDLKYLRSNSYQKKSIESFMIILFILFFTYDLMQYMNWFLPLSLFTHGEHHWWYIFLAMYLGSRTVFYAKEGQRSKSLNIKKLSYG